MFVLARLRDSLLPAHPTVRAGPNLPQVARVDPLAAQVVRAGPNLPQSVRAGPPSTFEEFQELIERLREHDFGAGDVPTRPQPQPEWPRAVARWSVTETPETTTTPEAPTSSRTRYIWDKLERIDAAAYHAHIKEHHRSPTWQERHDAIERTGTATPVTDVLRKKLPKVPEPPAD